MINHGSIFWWFYIPLEYLYIIIYIYISLYLSIYLFINIYYIFIASPYPVSQDLQVFASPVLDGKCFPHAAQLAEMACEAKAVGSMRRIALRVVSGARSEEGQRKCSP